MKKNYIAMLAIAAGAVLVSCSKEADEPKASDSDILTFTVCAPSADETRAHLDNFDNLKLIWDTTDQLKVWADNNSSAPQIYNYGAGTGNNYATFSGTNPGNESTGKYYIMHPVQSDATFDGTHFTATIPTEQKAVANGFDPAAIISVAATTGKEDKNISLKHVCAFMKVTTTQACKSISVTALQGLKLAGKMTISSEAKVSDYSAGEETVKLVPSSGTSFEAGTYLIAFAASDSYKGFTISVDYESDSYKDVTTDWTSGAEAFSKGYVYNLGTVPAESSSAKSRTFAVYAPGADAAATRAHLDNLDNLKLIWDTTDKLQVWANNTYSTSQQFNYGTGTGNNYATFTGTDPADDSTEKYYIMHPYQSDATFDGTHFTATIPTSQVATANGFDPAAILSFVATTGKDDKNVSLKHACAFMKVTTTQACKEISITAKEGLKLAGKMSFSSEAKVTTYTTGEGTVKLVPGSGSSFAAGTYLIAFAASDSYKGFTVKVDYESDSYKDVETEWTSGAEAFSKGYVYNLGTVPAETK